MLDAFDTPPAFELWNNPVTDKAQTLTALGPDGNRSLIADEIFRNCSAKNLCDDGHQLVDGGINQNHRLWLIYRFHSLTDYDDRQNYTSIAGLISVVRNDQNESEFFFGFDWKRDETLSRLVLDEPENVLWNTVFKKAAWHAVHRLIHRPDG